MHKILIRLVLALAIGAGATLTAGRNFTSLPAKIVVFAGTAVIAFVVLSMSNKKQG